MNKIKDKDYYKNYILSINEMHNFNKPNYIEKTENIKTEKVIYEDKPSTEEMLDRVTKIIDLCSIKNKKFNYNKFKKLLVVAVIAITVGVFGVLSVSSDISKFFVNIMNINNSKYILKENSTTGDKQTYSSIKQIMPQLDFIPIVPKYLPNDIKFTNIEPIKSGASIDLYFEGELGTITIREKHANNDNRRIGTSADTENSKQIQVNSLNKDLAIYYIEREGEKKSISYNWSIGEMQYSLVSYNINEKEIIKLIESLYYLK